MSTLVRSIGSASQRQSSLNKTHSFLALHARHLADGHQQFQLQFQRLHQPDAAGDARTAAHFPSLQDGASFRVPQQTKQRRFQFSDTFTFIRGNHTFYAGGEIQRVLSDLDLKVFQQGASN